jgi:hypothetical protein
VPSVYFAAGCEDEPFSQVWKVWTHRRDVYVGARSFLGSIKVSLHASGVWRAAWTEESGVKATHGSDRVEHRWTRPPEFTAGWTQGPSIRFVRTHAGPWVPPGSHPRPPRRGAVIWLAPPELGEGVWITVLLQSRPTDRQPLREGDAMIGSIPMETGEMVWLAVRREGLSDELAAHYARARDDTRITPGGGDPGEIDSASLLEFDRLEDNLTITEVTFGPENIGPPIGS